MKKTFSFAVTAAVLAAGCATTGTTPSATSANQPMTLEQALQKSAETRQKLLDAKQSYQDAKTAAEVASGNKSPWTLPRRNCSRRQTTPSSKSNPKKTPGWNCLNKHYFAYTASCLSQRGAVYFFVPSKNPPEKPGDLKD